MTRYGQREPERARSTSGGGAGFVLEGRSPAQRNRVQANSATSAGRATSTTSTPLASGAAPAGNRASRRLPLIRPMPVLIGLMVFMVVAVVGVGAFVGRANALAAAQDRTTHDVAMVRAIISQQGPNLTLQNGRLAAGVDNASFVLNNNTTLVDSAQQVTGDQVTIYQLEGPNLTAISTTVARAGSPRIRALGDHLGGAAYTALLGNCGAISTSACHSSYAGLATVGGAQYVASFQPLKDASGNFVGAISTARPMSTVTAAAMQLAVLLALVALLVAVVVVVAGGWLLSGGASASGVAADRMRAALAGIDGAASGLRRLAEAQAPRARRQRALAAQLEEHGAAFDDHMQTISQEQAALRNATSAVWAEVSQPGAPDPAAALAHARQAAVHAARIGAAIEDMRSAYADLREMTATLAGDADDLGEQAGQAAQQAAHLHHLCAEAQTSLGDQPPKTTPANSSGPSPRRPQAGYAGAAPDEFSPSATGHLRAQGRAASGGGTGQHPATIASGRWPTASGNLGASAQHSQMGQGNAQSNAQGNSLGNSLGNGHWTGQTNAMPRVPKRPQQSSQPGRSGVLPNLDTLTTLDGLDGTSGARGGGLSSRRGAVPPAGDANTARLTGQHPATSGSSQLPRRRGPSANNDQRDPTHQHDPRERSDNRWLNE